MEGGRLGVFYKCTLCSANYKRRDQIARLHPASTTLALTVTASHTLLPLTFTRLTTTDSHRSVTRCPCFFTHHSLSPTGNKPSCASTCLNVKSRFFNKESTFFDRK